MASLPDAVRPLLPMRILLVTGEAGYANEWTVAAEAIGLALTATSADDDIERTARRLGANVVVFDAEADFEPTVCAATAFAAVHPLIVVGVVATGVDDRHAGNLLVAHRWRSAERLLATLESVYGVLGREDESRPSVGA